MEFGLAPRAGGGFTVMDLCSGLNATRKMGRRVNFVVGILIHLLWEEGAKVGVEL